MTKLGGQLYIRDAVFQSPPREYGADGLVSEYACRKTAEVTVPSTKKQPVLSANEIGEFGLGRQKIVARGNDFRLGL